MKNSKWEIIVPILVVIVLAAAFYIGGNGVGLHDWSVFGKDLSVEASKAPGENPDNIPKKVVEDAPSQEPNALPSPTMNIKPETGRDKQPTSPLSSSMPSPVVPAAEPTGEVAYTCTLSISCATILDNMDMLDENKRELVPKDGWILKPTAVTFYEGESAFNVLQRTLKQQGIHMEFVETPVLSNVYIEGIANLYEFDVGELSGWLYKINGLLSSHDCSHSQLQSGDVIEFVYTCDFGNDIGGGATGSLQNTEK